MQAVIVYNKSSTRFETYLLVNISAHFLGYESKFLSSVSSNNIQFSPSYNLLTMSLNMTQVNSTERLLPICILLASCPVTMFAPVFGITNLQLLLSINLPTMNVMLVFHYFSD